MLYSQLSDSNHRLNVTTSVSSGWPRKWGRGNVKSSNSGKNHPILTNDPSKCLSEWVLLCFVCFMQTSLIGRSPGVKRLQNLDQIWMIFARVTWLYISPTPFSWSPAWYRGGHIQWVITTTKLWVQHCYEVVSWPMGIELSEKHW